MVAVEAPLPTWAGVIVVGFVAATALLIVFVPKVRGWIKTLNDVANPGVAAKVAEVHHQVTVNGDAGTLRDSIERMQAAMKYAEEHHSQQIFDARTEAARIAARLEERHQAEMEALRSSFRVMSTHVEDLARSFSAIERTLEAKVLAQAVAAAVSEELRGPLADFQRQAGVRPRPRKAT